MAVVALYIYRTVSGRETLVARANKWKFQDAAMGEQFITCTITSETPIDWEVGDHCKFRGETYTLNYIPTVTQKAPINSVQDAFTYENVKFDSFQDELTRCMMLDITPTTPEYQAVLGTNHTGSSRFQLFCGETTVNGATLTAVCALALKIQANLDRLYPDKWKVYVDTTTTYVTASGEVLLTTHTDSKVLTFDNSTVSQALGMVHTEFKLDYCVKGRNIYIGYSVDSIDPLNPIADITADDADERFVFGYGRGYADASSQGKSLFQIKQVANSQQRIVTRLRALGSTKNLPYNYYFKKYGLLSQALFPNNLQLPGTFLPLGYPSDSADAGGETKWAQNNARSQNLRKVLGDTNDSYIDKNDDAASCPEGIREDCARWDGSNGDLPEIYPTIEGITFGELRNAGVPDQTGATGAGAYQGHNVQPDEERVDCLLAVGYTDDGILIDDANIGDGVMPEDEVVDRGTHFPIGIGQLKLNYNPVNNASDFIYDGVYFEGKQQELFTVKDVTPGNYFMVPTGPSYSCVAYRFALSGNGVSASVGFVIRVKQIVNGAYSTIATWYSDFIPASATSGEHEMYLPELPDVGTGGQVESLSVTEQCDIVVTFAPVLESLAVGGMMSFVYQVGKSESGEYDPEYTWCAIQGDVASKYPFHVFIKDMGFDLTATFNGETPVMAMKSGMCVGREFEIGENVQKATVNGKRGYLLTLNRVEDSNLHTYYPNKYYGLSAGDYFVLLNINMPDAYIRAAELRLLKAATEYLADNCETKYTYQPSLDDIYLQRNYDAMMAAGTPEKSIFWRLYAGLKFRFNGIPSSAGAPLPLVNMTIEQVTITMGDGLTPKVDISLNDDVQQTTLQKLTIAVDRIYNGSLFSTGGVGTNLEAIADIGDRMFLSKTHDDVANGRITFNDIATFLELIKAKGGIDVGDYLSGFLGNGAHIGFDGKSEFEEVTVRGALRAAEFVFNRISAEEGEAIRSIGHGEILEVDEGSMTATLKLDGDEWPTIEEGDICRGLYNTINKDYDNAEVEGEDTNGFRMKPGFFASYFRVDEVLSSGKGECSFRYSLQTDGNGDIITEHPCPLMKFAVYGNTDNNKKERQSSMYITAIGIAPRMLYLSRVNTWKIQPENIKVALGYLNGLEVWEVVDGEPQIKVLDGDAGLYVEDNVFLGGIINQFTSADWDAIQEHLGNGIHAQLTRGSDNIVVDALGNIVNGIYVTEGDTKRYKLRTGITVYDSGKKEYLSAKPISDNTPIKEGEFKITHTCDGCTVQRDGADFYVTSIDNTNDGISGTVLTDEELDLMRETSQCVVNFIIEAYNGWKTVMSYPVKITHLDYAYVTFDLSNEYDSMSYRTQTKRYVGLPITTYIKAFVNGAEANVITISVQSDLFNGSIVTLNGGSQRKNLQCGLYVEVNGNTLTIDHNNSSVIDGSGNQSTAETDLEDAKHWFDINAVARYAGIPYESGNMRFTVAETTDTTIYKLLVSANAVLKEGSSYTPSSIEVKVQVIDDNGMNVRTDVWMESNSSVKVRYMKGVYNASKEMYSTCPAFSDPTVVDCVTVLLVDTTDGTLLDIESVTINSKGLDGAGQSYIATNVEEVVIDCDSDGKILADQHFDVVSSLYWGDHKININDWSYTYNGTTNGNQGIAADLYEVTVRYTFNRGDVLSTSYIEIFIDGEVDGGGDEHGASKSIPVRPNKQGKDGKTGSPGASIVFVGEWTDSRLYTWNDYIRHAVKYNGYYWLVNVRVEDAALDIPSTSSNDWVRMSTMEFVATQLLLAENGAINLLSSNIINLFGVNGIRTASINEDGNGAYRIYYPSGKKMMEFSPDGYIYYYNDNPNNSVEWKLGHGGSILNSQSDDWKPIYLHLLSTQELNSFNGNTTFSRTEYYQFFNGTNDSFPNAEKKIFTGKPNNNNPYNPEPSTIVAISDGLYTPNSKPMHKIDDDSEQLNYSIVVYQIIGGKIDNQYVRVLIDGNYYDEPY